MIPACDRRKVRRSTDIIYHAYSALRSKLCWRAVKIVKSDCNSSRQREIATWPSRPNLWKYERLKFQQQISPFSTTTSSVKVSVTHRVNDGQQKNKKADLSQRRPRDVPNIWVPWRISRVLNSKRLLFPKLYWAFVPIDTKNVRTKLEVRSFTRSWGNRGYWKIFRQSLDTPTLPFLPNF